MMEERELKELVSLFEQSSLQVMEIEKKEGALRIRMEKGGAQEAAPAAQAAQTAPALQAAGSASAPAPSLQKPEAGLSPNWEKVTAPLVGTFYAAPSPDEPPFVQVGQQVEKGQVLCLIEAMKMMNELKSPVSGTIRRICGENGALAEFGQVLFEIETGVAANGSSSHGGTSC